MIIKSVIKEMSIFLEQLFHQDNIIIILYTIIRTYFLIVEYLLSYMEKSYA